MKAAWDVVVKQGHPNSIKAEPFWLGSHAKAERETASIWWRLFDRIELCVFHRSRWCWVAGRPTNSYLKIGVNRTFFFPFYNMWVPKSVSNDTAVFCFFFVLLFFFQIITEDFLFFSFWLLFVFCVIIFLNIPLSPGVRAGGVKRNHWNAEDPEYRCPDSDPGGAQWPRPPAQR